MQEKIAQQKKKQSAEQKKKGCGCCKWALGSIVLIALIAGALLYDTEVNGKGVFAKSATGKVLQNAGLLPHCEKAWYTSMSAAARGYKWAEKNLPPYTRPVCQLICDVSKLLRNAACNAYNIVREVTIAKLPVVSEFVSIFTFSFLFVLYTCGLLTASQNTSLFVASNDIIYILPPRLFFKRLWTTNCCLFPLNSHIHQFATLSWFLILSACVTLHWLCTTGFYEIVFCLAVVRKGHTEIFKSCLKLQIFIVTVFRYIFTYKSIYQQFSYTFISESLQLEQYVPGLPKKIESTAETVKTVSVDVYEKTLVFFKTQVLV